MTGLLPLADDGTVPDVFLAGQPYEEPSTPGGAS
jgi:hypothetical protein